MWQSGVKLLSVIRPLRCRVKECPQLGCVDYAKIGQDRISNERFEKVSLGYQ